ncbi:hypothetical protein [Clostridium sp.]|uniref:hypothetical protein n=1 Tax=Clostridium sp. TaxID=1506 RepID=UPI002604C333|nr:hypothetical protein [Clostridium sp.]
MGRFEIGKPYEEGITRYPEGVKFDIGQNECNLLIYAEDPTDKERQAIVGGELKYGYFKEDNVIILLFRFGNHQWIDVPYSIHMSKKLVELNYIEGQGGYILNIHIINARTGILEDIRSEELDGSFSNMFREDILAQEALEYNGFNSKVNEFMSQFTVKALVSMSRVLI